MRPRISQMLVLPPFQRQGLGAKLLHAVSKHYWSIPKVVDITGRTKFLLFPTLLKLLISMNRVKNCFPFQNVKILQRSIAKKITKIVSLWIGIGSFISFINLKSFLSLTWNRGSKVSFEIWFLTPTMLVSSVEYIPHYLFDGERRFLGYEIGCADCSSRV